MWGGALVSKLKEGNGLRKEEPDWGESAVTSIVWLLTAIGYTPSSHPTNVTCLYSLVACACVQLCACGPLCVCGERLDTAEKDHNEKVP